MTGNKCSYVKNIDRGLSVDLQPHSPVTLVIQHFLPGPIVSSWPALPAEIGEAISPKPQMDIFKQLHASVKNI